MYDLYDDIAGYLAYSRKVGRELDDRFLRDFSAAWGTISRVDGEHGGAGVRDAIPTWLDEEYRQFQEAQKASTTVVDFGSAVHVSYGDGVNRVSIFTSRGVAEFPRNLCGAIGRLLISLDQPEVVSPGSPTHAPGANIPQGIAEATWNGMTKTQQANWQRNQSGLEYALKVETERQNRTLR